ncbi:MAG TPA: pilus assembly protein PilZ [Gammaproteobacteria bacterium]|jgi:type IV pilus assembly protein PilZ|nr:PilZ domain-containing protein [Gammaproteobacteria bacterium]HAJ75517.1 pilus assembly protein PilZ [Gammaproteobacteria bacterium]|tara:strand:- start:263 stop:598 length:336 start_codon:yes stop_codon:yes gene_type:complete
MSNQTFLSVYIKDKDDLYALYMPFIMNGGLFIPFQATYDIGAELFLILGLPDQKKKLTVSTRVTWISHSRAQACKLQGIGIQFVDTDGASRSCIEEILANRLNNDTATLTI